MRIDRPHVSSTCDQKLNDIVVMAPTSLQQCRAVPLIGIANVSTCGDPHFYQRAIARHRCKDQELILSWHRFFADRLSGCTGGVKLEFNKGRYRRLHLTTCSLRVSEGDLDVIRGLKVMDEWL
jgi:hypothetical protein